MPFHIDEIVHKENIYYLIDLWSQHQALLNDLSVGYGSTENFKDFTPQCLEKKLLKEQGGVIVIKQTTSSHQKKIVFKYGISISKPIDVSLITKCEKATKFRDVAYSLRQQIKTITKKEIPEKIGPDAIVEGECIVPEKLLEFIGSIVKGPDIRRQNSDDDSIKILSLCQDIIYIVTKGRIKKYGHSIGYTTAEELETELTYTASENNTLIPSGITRDPQLSTNRYVDTLSGKNTLHDTVGIIYQFIPKNQIIRKDLLTLSAPQNKTAIQKRRKFEEVPIEILPYYKNLRRTRTSLFIRYYFFIDK